MTGITLSTSKPDDWYCTPLVTQAVLSARLHLQAAKAKAPSSISARRASAPSAAVDETEPQKENRKGGRPAGAKDKQKRVLKGGKATTTTSEAAPAE